MHDTKSFDEQLLRDDIAYVTRSLSRSAYQRYDSYAYSAAYFESLAADLISILPLADQEYWLGVIQRTIDDLSKEPHV